jgi:hypothetical protein
MNTKSTVAIVAIVAISAILVGSVLADDAMAKKCKRYRGNGGGGGNDNSVHQTSAQACVNDGARCQNVNSQNAGHDIASNTIGNQP